MSDQAIQYVVYLLTALAAVVVALTRLRLRRGGAGRLSMGPGLVHVHTIAGTTALLSWTAFLVAPEDHFLGTSTFGIIALAFWWLTAIAGLMILMRWRRPRGRHASEGAADSWSDGPGLSLLGHVGLLVGVCIFTWAYLNSIV